MRRIARLLPLAWAANAVGCALHAVDPAAVASEVKANPHLYIPMCGYVVAGVEDVVVEPRLSSRTAVVTGKPLAWRGSAAAPRCEGEVAFDSKTVTDASGRGTSRSIATWNVRLVSRLVEPGEDLAPGSSRIPAPRPDRPMPVRWEEKARLAGEGDGATYSGLLADEVSSRQNGRLANDYAMQLPAAVPLTFEMGAKSVPGEAFSTVNPRLELLLNDTVVATSVPLPTRDHVRLDLWVRDPGVYTLRATSERTDGSGSYYVKMRRSMPRELAQQATLPLTVDQTVTGELDPAYPPSGKPLLVDYAFDVPPGASVSAEVVASDDARRFRHGQPFVPKLSLLRASTVIAASDDSDPRAARVTTGLLPPGTYVVRVSPRDPSSNGGTFALRITLAAAR